MKGRVYGFVLALGLVARVASPAQVPSDNTAHDLFAACKDAIRFMDAKGHGDPGRSDYCLGYFEGYANVVSVDSSAICIGRARVGTMVRVYVAYMERNPKELDFPNVIGATEALKDSYPCTENNTK